jgi:hypothetical protein
MLDAEIDAATLSIATDKMQDSGLMEWPKMKRADKKKTISLWVKNRAYVKAGVKGKENERIERIE